MTHAGVLTDTLKKHQYSYAFQLYSDLEVLQTLSKESVALHLNLIYKKATATLSEMTFPQSSFKIQSSSRDVDKLDDDFSTSFL